MFSEYYLDHERKNYAAQQCIKQRTFPLSAFCILTQTNPKITQEVPCFIRDLAVIEMKRTLTLIILGLVFITGCSEQTPVITDKQPQPEKHNHFIGIWESLERDIPFGATLTINADSSFQYDFGACMTHGMSEGFWQLDGDVLVLNSGNDDSCKYTSEFGVDCIPIDSADSKLANRTLSKSDCASKSSDYFVLFNNDRFQIVKDTLIHQFDQPKLCPEIRNDFKKKTTANNR